MPDSREEPLPYSASEMMPVGGAVPKATAHQQGCVGRGRDAELPHPGIATESICFAAHIYVALASDIILSQNLLPAGHTAISPGLICELEAKSND